MRVATYNLYLGADLALLFGVPDLAALTATVRRVREQLDRTCFAERAGAVAALLARERPDLVGLQEVARWTSRSRGADGSLGPEQLLEDFLPALLAALEALGCGYDAHGATPNVSGELPVSATEQVSVSLANVTLVRRGAGIEVVREASAPFSAAHRLATGIEGISFPIVRSWSRLDVRVDGAPLRFVNTHTEAWDRPVRDAQRDELLRLNADVEGPVVVVGDLNATPDLVGMPADWTDAWSAGAGDGFTCGQAADLANEVGTLGERIDYVWVRGARVDACRVVGADPDDRTAEHRLWPSDHAGVVADLGFPSGR